MSMKLEKRSPMLGPDYWEGTGDGKTTTATPYTDMFGNKGYTVEEYNHNTGESNTYDVTKGTDFLGNDYVHVNQTSHSAAAPSEFSAGGFGIFFAIILIPALIALPVQIWKFAFSSFQEYTIEPALSIISVVIGSIIALCSAHAEHKSSFDVIFDSTCSGISVSTLLGSAILTLYYFLFESYGFLDSLGIFLGGCLICGLLGIIPCAVGSIIGSIAGHFSTPKKR